MVNSTPKYSSFLTPRDPNTHKGDYGHVAVIAGSLGMIGASVLSGKAALRVGAGLATLYVPEDIQLMVNAQIPELMAVGLTSFHGRLTPESFEDIQTVFLDKKISTFAIGPGLGRSDKTVAFIRLFLDWAHTQSRLYGVIDADALFALKQTDFSRFPKEKYCLTPHSGEFVRLFRRSGKTAAARLSDAQFAAHQSRQVLVLKGHRTVIASPTDFVVNQTGNPNMATAGSGDVLTGVIAGFLAQGLPLHQAAQLGVYIHGLAGDMASQEKGIGLIASDIIHYLPRAILSI